MAPAGRLPAIRATWYAGEKTGRLDVDMLLGDERQLQGAFAGIGSGEDGLQDALRDLASDSFHVPLSVLQGQAEEDQVMVETWEIDEWRFEVHIDNSNLRGAKGGVPPLPAGLLPSVKRVIRVEPLDVRLYWLRRFFCTFGDQYTVEALFDNRPWEAGIQNLTALDWRGSQDYYSVRNFLTFKPLAQATTSCSPQGVDGGSVPARSSFDEFDLYRTTSTATALRPLADGTMQMSLFIGRRRHGFQMRCAQG